MTLWSTLIGRRSRWAEIGRLNGSARTSSVRTDPMLQVLALSVARVEELYVVGIERIGRKVHAHIGQRLEPVEDGVLKLEVVIPEGYRPSITFHYGTLAGMRVYPRLKGFPDATVEANIQPMRSTYRVTLPTVCGSMTEADVNLSASMPPLECAPADVLFALNDVEHQQVVIPVGQKMAQARSLQAVFDIFVAHVRWQFRCWLGR